MKKFFWFVLAVLVVVFSTRVYAFYGSDKVEEKRPLKGFERIRLQGSPDIKYTQGKTWSVRVKAPKSIIKNVQTRIEGNCLGSFFSFISFYPSPFCFYRPLMPQSLPC